MLTGSFASGFHGASRATQDIDFVIAPSLDALDAFLANLNDRPHYVDKDDAHDALRQERMFNIIDLNSGWKIDLICRKSRPFSLEEFSRRQQEKLADTSVFVASAEDCILSKLEWAKLSESERQLNDAAGIVRIQSEQLDTSYISIGYSNLD